MALSETDICNLALAKLGSAQIIALTDPSKEGRFCSRFYAQVRDEVLSENPWNFAIQRAALSRDSTPPLYGWNYRYALPTNCLRVLDMNHLAEFFPDNYQNWKVEGGFLVTNDAAPKIRYIARIEDANLFTALFTEALSTKIAYRLCLPLTGSREQPPSILEEYERIVGPRAMQMNAFEQHPGVPPAHQTSSFVQSRYGESADYYYGGEGAPLAAPEPVIPPTYYVYICGGVAIKSDSSQIYSISSTPALKATATGAPFTVEYASLVPFPDILSSSIEIMVYEGLPYPNGTKVAYGNKISYGNLVGASITLNALGCFETAAGLPWNFNCSGL